MIITEYSINSYVLQALTSSMEGFSQVSIVGGYARDTAIAGEEHARDMDIALYGYDLNYAAPLLARARQEMRALGYIEVAQFDSAQYVDVPNLQVVLKFQRPGHIAVDLLFYALPTLQEVLDGFDFNINQYAATVTPETYPYADVCFYGAEADYRQQILRRVLGGNLPSMERLHRFLAYATDNGWCLSQHVRELVIPDEPTASADW